MTENYPESIGEVTEVDEFDVYKDSETGLYVAHHQNLPISSCGPSEPESVENAKIAVSLYDKPEGPDTPDYNLE